MLLGSVCVWTTAMILQKCTLIIFVAMVFRLNFFITKSTLCFRDPTWCSAAWEQFLQRKLCNQRTCLLSLAEVWFDIMIACSVLKTEGSSCLHSFIEVLSSSTDVRSVSAVHCLRKIRPSFSGATHCIPIIYGHICRCWMMYVHGNDVSIF